MSIRKRTLVMMAGLPGSGKSTIAKKLMQELKSKTDQKCFIAGKDGHLQDLQSGIEDYWKAGYATYEQIFRFAKHMLSEQIDIVILDSAALESFVLKETNQLVSELQDVQLKIILCIADRNTRNKRIRERTPQITRIKVDPFTLDDYMRCFEHLPEDKLILNTQAPIEDCCDLAMKYLQGVSLSELAEDESKANGRRLVETYAY